MKKYTDKVTISKELFNQTNVTEEMIIKQMLQRMITNMTLDELNKLCSVVKIDPENEDIKSIMYDYKTDPSLVEQLKYLSNYGLIEYKCEMVI